MNDDRTSSSNARKGQVRGWREMGRQRERHTDRLGRLADTQTHKEKERDSEEVEKEIVSKEKFSMKEKG